MEANFRRSVIIAELRQPEVARLENFVSNYCVFFGKTIPLKLSLLRGSRPKSARANAQYLAHTVPDFIEISSLLAEFLPNPRRPFCHSAEYLHYRLFELIVKITTKKCPKNFDDRSHRVLCHY